MSQAAKPQHLGDPLLISRDRRNFLIRCCQGLSAALVPLNLWSLALPSGSPSESSQSQPAGGEYYLHPHYRAKLPVETTLLKTPAGTDNFVTEKYADQIGAILSEWSAALQQAPTQTGVIEKVFSPQFFGFFVRSHGVSLDSFRDRRLKSVKTNSLARLLWAAMPFSRLRSLH